MKSYIILALLVGFSLADGTCQKFTCGSLTDQCVGVAAATADVTVMACPTGKTCIANSNALTQAGITALKNTIVTTAQTCADNVIPDPVKPSGISGDSCSVDDDCKGTAGFTCVSGACNNKAIVVGTTACATD